MPTPLRVVGSMLAVLSLVLGTAGGALAASPAPTLGGRLSASSTAIYVSSGGNVPVAVAMTAESVTLDTYRFSLQPGEERAITYTGSPEGRVTATYAVLETGPGETSGVTLSVSLTEVPPPTNWAPLGLLALLAAVVVIVTRRVRPWRYRLVRAP